MKRFVSGIRKLTVFAVLGPPILLQPSSGSAQGIVIHERPVPLEIISGNMKVKAFRPLIPLEDLANALGSRLEFDSRSGRYSVQPTGNGVLEFASQSPELRRLPGPGPVPRGIPSGRMGFRVGDQLVSRGIIIVDGKPYFPVADLASVRNSTLERSVQGAWTLVPRPNAGPGILRLSEHGIIIVDNIPRVD